MPGSRAQKEKLLPSVKAGSESCSYPTEKQFKQTGKKGNDKPNEITGKAFVNGKVQ